MDKAERPDHKYTIPTYHLPVVLELSTFEVRMPRNGKSRDSRFVTSYLIYGPVPAPSTGLVGGRFSSTGRSSASTEIG